MIKISFIGCAGLLAAASTACAQTAAPPTTYVITEAVMGGAPGASTMIFRDGNKVVTVTASPAQGATPASRTVSYFDLDSKATYTWDPLAKPITCSAGTNSGDWGDPFGMTAQLNAEIAKGELKAAGTEMVGGVSTQVYSGSSAQGTMKAWVDPKTGLVMRAVISAAGSQPMTLVDIRHASYAPPPPGRFDVPAACKGVKPAATAADLIGEETGDDAANYVNGMYGPGSKDTCSVVLRVVQAGTLAPIAHIQVALDTSYKQENPPHYDFGVHDDGTTTYSGGHVLEITNRAHNGVVRLGNPPPYFMLGVNLIHPGHAGDLGLVYRQCFSPTTVLLYVVKNYGTPKESGDFLWVKAGKNATAPPL